MSLNDPRIDVLRDRFNAMQRRKEVAAANAAGSYLGAYGAGYPFRFVLFINKLERYNSARLRFANHTARVAYELLPPIAQFIEGVA